MNELNLFTLVSFILGFSCIVLSGLIYFNSKGRVHRLWSLFNFNVGCWGIFLFFAGQSRVESQALFFWKLSHVSVVFIPVFFYHFAIAFCKQEHKIEILLAYIQAIIFSALLLFTNLILGEVHYRFDSFYYFIGTPIYLLMLFIWSVVVFSSFKAIYRQTQKASSLRLLQLKYLFWGSMLGFVSGPTVILPAYIDGIYPIYHIFIFIYALIATYAIFKYQLMDIRVAFSRLGIFVFVYAVVLGVPFLFGYRFNMWRSAMWSMLLLATSGPFIYLFFQRKAEERLLEEERNINKLLTQASYGMTAIQNLPALLNSMTSTLYEILQVKSVRIYMLNQAVNQYELKEPRGENHSELLSGEDALVKMLIKRRAPLVYDEFKARAEGASETEMVNGILIRMQEMKSSVVVPFIIDSRLLGFVALGERGGHQGFSGDLLNALGVLGNQAALAVTNCYFLEDEARRMEKAGLEERRVSLDHVTSSMAHEIDNPMAVIQGQIDVLEMELEDPRVSMPEDLRQSIRESMDYISEARQRVSGMIQAIREYSKATTGILKPITIYDVESGYWKLFGHEFKKDANRDVEYVREIAEGLPMILGDSIQLEEVFFNLANNALYAVQRSPVKRIALKIFQKDQDWIRMEYADTGCGIDQKIINDIFLAHVTTKGSAEGSGLGLYRVRKVIELHKGRIWAESDGKDKGTRMIIELPVYHGEN